MIEFLRKLFGRKPKPTEYTDGLIALALKRGQEKLPCCGGMRRAHVAFRSGTIMCPPPYRKLTAEDLRYNPLEIDEEFEPPWSEPHFTCDSCGCKRGVHKLEGWKRTTCMDPDCPGCTGCHL